MKSVLEAVYTIPKNTAQATSDLIDFKYVRIVWYNLSDPVTLWVANAKRQLVVGLFKELKTQVPVRYSWHSWPDISRDQRDEVLQRKLL